jgi:hypothetical protein
MVVSSVGGYVGVLLVSLVSSALIMLVVSSVLISLFVLSSWL